MDGQTLDREKKKKDSFVHFNTQKQTNKKTMYLIRIVIWLCCWWNRTTTNLVYMTSVVVAATATATATATAASINTNRTTEFRIAGYLPDYRFGLFQETNNHLVKYIDDLILFSVAPKLSTNDPYPNDVCCLNSDYHFPLARATREYKQQQNTTNEFKIWLSVGGAARSDGIINANRDAFVNGLIRIIQKEQIDAIDIDCEIQFRTKEEYQKYTDLLVYTTKTLKKKIPNILVSVAIHVNQLLPKVVYQTIDRIHLMTYDLSSTEYHASMSLVQQGVQKLIDSGCPPHKIFLGIPAYGRHQRIFQDTKTYSELIDRIVITKKKQKQQDYSKISSVDGYLFESQRSVVKKVKYAYQLGLGGVVFWEIGQDKYIAVGTGSSSDLGNIGHTNTNEKYSGGMLLYSAAKGRQDAIQNDIFLQTTAIDSTILENKNKIDHQEL